jgi:DNA excision repair protein ERCC-3
MPPKRKATSAADALQTKRVASEAATPTSLVTSDDEFDDDGDYGDEDTGHLKAKFSIESYAAKYAGQRTRRQDAASALFQKRDHSGIELKADHAFRPIWIEPDKAHLIVESFSPSFRDAESLLINIAEPVSRVSRMHEYVLTSHSLFAAVSVGLTTQYIINRLDHFSKTALPQSIVEFIVNSTSTFGKVRLVLKHTRYFIESSDPSVLQTLLKDPIIADSRVVRREGEDGELAKEAAPKLAGLVIPGTQMAAGAKQAVQDQQKKDQDEEDEEGQEKRETEDMFTKIREEEDEEDEVDEVHSFEIKESQLQIVQKRCREIDLPLTEEYDFRNDEANANLEIDLKPSAKIRDYQEKALGKMFSNGRARSGIIVLPCGAGKTLVGITAACTVRKGIIVLCTSAMSVSQWRGEFLKWSNINPSDIAMFTSSDKQKFSGNTGIVISTYSMMTQSKVRSHDTQKIMDFIQQREWGLMILDEVHVVPAEMFKRVTLSVASHSKLGLTATLLREDEKIGDLNFLIGPKLYEANWQELSEQGHIARVQCAEVWCPMTTEFYSEYLRADQPNKRSLIFTMNPRKFQACQFLIDFHKSRGDKIIVFSDNVYALRKYAERLMCPFIYGATGQDERMHILSNFQLNEKVPCIFLSKIGDTSLDLPEATCLIQISSHYGSRRQEAQRLGRILRAKRRNDAGFNAFFYSLVSKDTEEMYYSSKRQAFLVDQGYAFQVITHFAGIEKTPDLAFTTPQERRELLADVMLQNETAGESEKIEGDVWGRQDANRRHKPGVKRTAGMLSDLSGGRDMAYAEFNKNKNKEIRKTAGNSAISKIRRQQQKKKAPAE